MPELFTLFKGITRVPTIMGVPMMPLLIMGIIVAAVSMIGGLLWYLMILPLWFIMAQITKHDDQAFRIWALWLETKWRHRSSHWQASTYSKIDYHPKK